jgi:VanZ family protein
MSIASPAKVSSVAALALLVFAALGPGKWVPRSGLGWQFDHVVGYLAFTWTFCLAWRRPRVVGGALMALAVVLEGLQALTPDRHADLHAALYNAGAVLAAALIAELFIRAPITQTRWMLWMAQPLRFPRPSWNNARTVLLMASGRVRVLASVVARGALPPSPPPVGLIAQPIPVSLRRGSLLREQMVPGRSRP